MEGAGSTQAYAYLCLRRDPEATMLRRSNEHAPALRSWFLNTILHKTIASYGSSWFRASKGKIQDEC